ncbi:MAG TPA: penicillin-binding protein 1A [Rhodanobacteraceae bacterium]|nr:penicillin-binding protein 1A [Rhodanobacteraceae bacterium]
MRILKRLLRIAAMLVLCLFLAGVLAVGFTYWLIAPRIPSVASLKDVQLQVPLRVESADGKLIALFGETRRIPVHIEQVPAQLKDAFLAAEDADFYHHPGVDWEGTARAAWHVLITGGNKAQGGSTITQQVARNFFLSPEKSYTRKLIEMFTAFRIENELSKDEILQLYLNKIFLGHRAYGVAAAAEFYYGKTLDQLTLPECAMLAGLPKSPTTGNPLYNRQHAIERRNYVLARMLDNRFITREQYQAAVIASDDAAPHEPPVQVDAPYLAEMVRRQAIERLGSRALTDGYVVHTTVDSRLQGLANAALRSRLEEYDHRHGYRGPEAHVDLAPQPEQTGFDKALADYHALSGLAPGLVTDVDRRHATVYLGAGRSVELDENAVKWAHGYARKAKTGGEGVAAILRRGDIIRVAQVQAPAKEDSAADKAAANGKSGADTPPAEPQWQLSQIPAAQSAMVVLDPENGALKALVGGFSFERSKFNRAVQTARQPGSSFKPFIYSAAFDRGFTPASIVNDAPIALPDPSKPNGLWTPGNDDGKFRGPMRLREALAESVNLVSIRLLDAIGVRYAREYITRFGFPPDAIPANLSLALGTASVSPMAMARGYSVFANGGFLINPYYVARIDDRDGHPVFTANPPRACRTCAERLLDEGKAVANAPMQPSAAAGDPGAVEAAAPAPAASAGGALANVPNLAPRVIDARNDYLVTSLMKSVIDHGTGFAAKKLGRTDLAGKTGSTNDHRDGWFCGFNGDLVTTVWVGFDNYDSLGRGEFGAETALPIWMAFMGPALQGKPENTLPMPPGIVSASVDSVTGALAGAGDPNAMNEIFKVEDLDRLRVQAQNQQDQSPAYDIF